MLITLKPFLIIPVIYGISLAYLSTHPPTYTYTNILSSYVLYQRLFSLKCINLCSFIQNVLHLRSLIQVQCISHSFVFRFLVVDLAGRGSVGELSWMRNELTSTVTSMGCRSSSQMGRALTSICICPMVIPLETFLFP